MNVHALFVRVTRRHCGNREIVYRSAFVECSQARRISPSLCVGGSVRGTNCGIGLEKLYVGVHGVDTDFEEK